MRALTLLFLSAALSLCVACSDSITSAPTVTVSVQPLRYFVETLPVRILKSIPLCRPAQVPKLMS